MVAAYRFLVRNRYENGNVLSTKRRKLFDLCYFSTWMECQLSRDTNSFMFSMIARKRESERQEDEARRRFLNWKKRQQWKVRRKLNSRCVTQSIEACLVKFPNIIVKKTTEKAPETSTKMDLFGFLQFSNERQKKKRFQEREE